MPVGNLMPPNVADQLWDEIRRGLDEGHPEAVAVHLDRLYSLCAPAHVAGVVERLLQYSRRATSAQEPYMAT